MGVSGCLSITMRLFLGKRCVSMQKPKLFVLNAQGPVVVFFFFSIHTDTIFVSHIHTYIHICTHGEVMCERIVALWCIAPTHARIMGNSISRFSLISRRESESRVCVCAYVPFKYVYCGTRVFNSCSVFALASRCLLLTRNCTLKHATGRHSTKRDVNSRRQSRHFHYFPTSGYLLFVLKSNSLTLFANRENQTQTE